MIKSKQIVFATLTLLATLYLLLFISSASAHGYLIGSRVDVCSATPSSVQQSGRGNQDFDQFGSQCIKGSYRFCPHCQEAPKAAFNPSTNLLTVNNGQGRGSYTLFAQGDIRLPGETTGAWGAIPAELLTNGNPNNEVDFRWTMTAYHRTFSDGFKYYITKDNWSRNPNRLTFADLEKGPDGQPKPFCTSPKDPTESVNFWEAKSPSLVHPCTLPAGKTGYHMIFARWEVADTSSAFYNTMDVYFNDPCEPSVNTPCATGPAPSLPLAKQGEKIKIVVQTTSTDSTPPKSIYKNDLTFQVQAGSPSSRSTDWTEQAAELLNTYFRSNPDSDGLYAGIKSDGQGNNATVEPGRGDLKVYTTNANQDLDLLSFTITDRLLDPALDVFNAEINNIADPILATNGMTTFSLSNITARAAGVDVDYRVRFELSQNNATSEVKSRNRNAGQTQASVTFSNLKEGTYTLTITANRQGADSDETPLVFNRYALQIELPTPDGGNNGGNNNGSSDGSAPAYVPGKTYKGGDTVKALDGSGIYQCKPWPYSGWCGQGGAYAPGTGWAWRDAWNKIGTSGGGNDDETNGSSSDSLPKYASGKTYTGGEKVKALDGSGVYQCKPWPFSGWCGQGGPYAPGTGRAWRQAWNKL